MQIGKKVVLVIFGICIPLLVAACLTGMAWLHGEANTIRSHVIERELASIESQINRELARFQRLQADYQTDYQAEKQAGSERQVIVSLLNDDYLETLAKAHFATQIKIAAGSAKPDVLLGNLFDNLFVDTVTAELNLPALLNQQQAHLVITFSNQLFSRMAWQFNLLLFGLLASVIALLLAGYFWLRVSVLKPLNRFSAQFIGLEQNAKQRLLISREEGGAFEVLTHNITQNINLLLDSVYQQDRQSQVILQSIAEVVILTDINANVSYINPYAERLLKLSSLQAQSKKLHELLPGNQSISDKVTRFLQRTSTHTESIHLRLDNGMPKLMSGSLAPFSNDSGEVIGAVLVLKDSTQEILLKRQLQRQTHLDPVTNLLNRAAFEDRFTAFSHTSQSLAVVYFDLEQFKLINDSCGHTVGDKMLSKVAKAIESCLPSNVLFGRIGGDEFGLILKDCSALNVAKLIKRIIASVASQMVTHNDTGYRVGVSAGVALSSLNKQTNLLELLKDADIACHAAKRKGCNQVHFYDARDQDLSYQRNAPKWAVRIVQAIERNELILYYQKIKCLSSHSQRQRLEILLRIQEPGGRILPPAQFIAAAERFKLIVDVDKEVIRKTFLWLSLNEPLWDDHCLSINLSGNSLGAEGMVDFILKQQRRFGIPSSCICFEITETSAIQNRSRAMKMLLDLRKRGFAFALDDFGSGFASYGYLKEMPVDYVKIDGCFVKNLAHNAKDYAIVKSVNDVCRVMGIETVAEFVENQEIIDKLEVIGINYAQGYGIGRPQALESYLSESVSAQQLA
ncbi:putative bifunctional diguanylate cyclase/phosphodiesterase [Shewanella sp. 125m-7]